MCQTLPYCQGKALMFNPRNNSRCRETLICQDAPHHREIPVVSSVGSVSLFMTSSTRAASLRGLEKTCVMCVKGCPVERAPASSVPVPSPACHPPPPPAPPSRRPQPTPSFFLLLLPLCSSLSRFPSPVYVFPLTSPISFVLMRRRSSDWNTDAMADVLLKCKHSHTICLPLPLSFFPSILPSPLFSHPQSIIQMSNALPLL